MMRSPGASYHSQLTTHHSLFPALSDHPARSNQFYSLFPAGRIMEDKMQNRPGAGVAKQHKTHGQQLYQAGST